MRGVQATPKLTATTLAVNEVFGPTFQGEGPTSGRRAAFLRLARCNLSCTWCDTPYTWDWSRYEPAREVHRLSVDELLERIDAMGVDRLVITGGEPLLQQARLLELLEACAARAWAVEVETNGTRAPLPAVAALVEQFNVAIKLADSAMAERARIRPAAIRALAGSGRAAFSSSWRSRGSSTRWRSSSIASAWRPCGSCRRPRHPRWSSRACGDSASRSWSAAGT